MKVPMATTNQFYDPVFKDGAFTSHDPRVRLYALQKTMRSMDLGAELGAGIYVFWGGREGAEVDAAKDPRDALKWYREALDFLCGYSIDCGYGYRFALEAKPNEPCGDIYLPTTGAMLAFIATLDHPEMVGVNPEVGHEQMSGLNFYHVVAQAIEAGKLFHIDLNDQKGQVRRASDIGKTNEGQNVPSRSQSRPIDEDYVQLFRSVHADRQSEFNVRRPRRTGNEGNHAADVIGGIVGDEFQSVTQCLADVFGIDDRDVHGRNKRN